MVTKRMTTTFGEPLYTLKELAVASNIQMKVLKEWFDNGDLKCFMTIYEAPTGRKFYRWGAPLYWEVPKYDHIYDLKTVVL